MAQFRYLNPVLVNKYIKNCILEDDLYGHSIISSSNYYSLSIICKTPCILAGIPFVKSLGLALNCKLIKCIDDGESVKNVPSVIAEFVGLHADLVKLERIASNILSYCSSNATEFSKLKDKVIKSNWKGKVKCPNFTPGLKLIDEYAKLVGGMDFNFCNSNSLILIKKKYYSDQLVLKNLVNELIKSPYNLQIQVECTNESDALCAASTGIHSILLNDLPTKELKTIADKLKLRHKAILIAVGGISEANLSQYFVSSIDVIDVSVLTASRTIVSFGTDHVLPYESPTSIFDRVSNGKTPVAAATNDKSDSGQIKPELDIGGPSGDHSFKSSSNLNNVSVNSYDLFDKTTTNASEASSGSNLSVVSATESDPAKLNKDCPAVANDTAGNNSSKNDGSSSSHDNSSSKVGNTDSLTKTSDIVSGSTNTLGAAKKSQPNSDASSSKVINRPSVSSSTTPSNRVVSATSNNNKINLRGNASVGRGMVKNFSGSANTSGNTPRNHPYQRAPKGSTDSPDTSTSRSIFEARRQTSHLSGGVGSFSNLASNDGYYGGSFSSSGVGSGPPLGRESDTFRLQRVFGVNTTQNSIGLGTMSMQRPPILASVSGNVAMSMQRGGGNMTFWSCHLCGQRNAMNSRPCAGCGFKMN